MASAVARAAAIPAIRCTSAATLLTVNLVSLCLGVAWLATESGTADQQSLLLGVILMGVGVSTLFSSGLVWLQMAATVTARATSAFLIGTSVGGQCIKPLVAYFIEKEPMALVYVVGVATVVVCLLFLVS